MGSEIITEVLELVEDLLLKDSTVEDTGHPMEGIMDHLVEAADLLADLMEEATEEDLDHLVEEDLDHPVEEDLDHPVEEAMDHQVVGVPDHLDMDSDQDIHLEEEEEVAVDHHTIPIRLHTRGLTDPNH